MVKYLCPKCGKNSYTTAEESFSPCPYCGFRFSGKYGSDRRHEERVREETAIVLACQGQHLDANTINFSQKGMGIKIGGEPPFLVGDTIDLSMSGLQIKAKVTWLNKLSNKSLVGLQRLN